MKNMLGMAAIAGALLVMAQVDGAAAADLSVAGRIQQTGACSMTLGNGGVIDFGTLTSRDLHQDREVWFRNPSISLSIDCQAPTKFAIKGLDNREGTSTRSGYGLGAIGGKKTGYYYLIPGARMGDGKALVQLFKDSWTWPDAWEVWGIEKTRNIYPNDLSSWAEPGQTTPQAFKRVTSELAVVIWIAPASKLDLSQEIAIDGSATLELVYL
ncbi:DUF1120 domain-containing protein [Pseudomonas aeruginosa]|uniref:DUF1120 domain-containing protein n=1 Tax=Pseudomonas aeruginosa TaxID=287 RepID=UPI001C13020E|nr:DUF1120 domain-containing protein [Pseudomonas aeruginosa]